jgi:hypothetical protein
MKVYIVFGCSGIIGVYDSKSEAERVLAALQAGWIVEHGSP